MISIVNTDMKYPIEMIAPKDIPIVMGKVKLKRYKGQIYVLQFITE